MYICMYMLDGSHPQKLFMWDAPPNASWRHQYSWVFNQPVTQAADDCQTLGENIGNLWGKYVGCHA